MSNKERYEIINGIRYDFAASPTFHHQQLVTLLSQAIYNTCHPNGIVVVAPMDVYLNERNIVQPDIIFISNENTEIIKQGRIEGIPDLLIEILSPSTSINDKILKKAQYERFGVQEYWIADPVHLIIDQFVLKDGKYYLHATYGDGDTVASEKFACILVSLGQLFDRLWHTEK